MAIRRRWVRDGFLGTDRKEHLERGEELGRGPAGLPATAARPELRALPARCGAFCVAIDVLRGRATPRWLITGASSRLPAMVVRRGRLPACEPERALACRPDSVNSLTRSG
ncbi:MAG: hypothetical protein ABSD97_02505 [Acidimicrobiales bacterium]